MEVEESSVGAEVDMSVRHVDNELKESENLLKQAKVDIERLKRETQSLTFVSSVEHEEIRLLELNSHLLKHVEGGGTLVFRGGAEDFPVLCTEDETYSVREAETSNSLLLVPDLSLGKAMQDSTSEKRIMTHRNIVGIHSKYLELRPVTKMKVGRLKELLEECPYQGPDKEMNAPGKRYGLSELVEVVQGSDTEILHAISSLPVCLIQGEYRWLDFDYLGKLVGELVELLDERDGMSWRSFLVDRAVLQMPQDIPKSVVEKFLKIFAQPHPQLDERWWLKEERVCRFFAEILLRPARRFNFQDFMEFWQASVPIGMIVNLRQLEGMVIVDEGSRVKTIEYFPVEDLPEDPQERFDHLFRHRQKWKEAEILGYLQDLETERLKVGTLLTKYCRSSLLNGIRIYNARESAFSRGN